MSLTHLYIMIEYLLKKEVRRELYCPSHKKVYSINRNTD